MLTLLMLIWQIGQAPTVGDTVWLTRTVRLPEGTSIRPRPVEASDILDPLGPPEVILREGSAILRYPIVFWRPGEHQIEIPGPTLVRPDGWSDTLRATRARISIASVLPDAPRDSVHPSPAAPPVDRANRSTQPVVILLILVGLVSLPVRFWWNRKGPAATARSASPSLPTPERLERWRVAGESRVVLDGWRDLLAALPSSEGREDLLHRLESTRYGDAVEDDVRALCSEARAFWEERRVPG